MSFVRLLLRNDTVCQCCLSQTNKLWHHGLPCSAVHVRQFSSTHSSSGRQLSVNRLQVGSYGFSPIRMKQNLRLQAAMQQTSKSSLPEMFEANVPVNKTVDPDVANFFREISVIHEKIMKLGLEPSTRWQHTSSVELVAQLHETVASLAPTALFHIVIDLPPVPEIDDFVKQLLLSEFQKSMRHLSVAQLLRVVQSRDRRDVGLDQSVYDSAMHSLQQRWVEIKSGRDIVTLLYIASDDCTHFLDRLEDRALDLCDRMTVKELYRTVYCLARRRRRNSPLLRALMYCLDRQELDLNPVHLSNLAFAMGVLNVRDQGVTEKLIKAVHMYVESRMHPPNVVRHMLPSVVQSLGILRWLDKRFMDMAVEHFLRLKVDSSDWVRLVRTLAWVNYLPPQLGKNGLVDIVRWIAPLSQSNSMLWLDAVWSCCVLDSLTSEMAASVLSPEFVAKLEADGIEPASFAAKLLTINAVARDTLPGYSQPLLSETSVNRLNNALESVTSRNDMFNSVVEALSEIAPAEHYLRTNVTVPSGHLIDVLMLVDDRGEPQPFADNSTDPAAKVATDHCIHRIAFQALEFTDMVSGGETVVPTGPSMLASRCFMMAGYKVVQVAYNEFDVMLPVVKRVQCLVRKVRCIVAQDSGTSETTKPEAVPETVVISTESKVDTSVSSVPASHERVGDFVRRLLKSDSFFSSDEQKISEGSSEFSDGTSISSVPDPSTKETKKRTRNKKTKSLEVQVDFATVAGASSADSKMSSSVTSDKEIKMTTADVSDLRVDSVSPDDPSSTVPEPPVTEVKKKGRRKKTKSPASDEIAQSS